MVGKTNFGYCWREEALWYEGMKPEASCAMPLSDGKPCGDSKLDGPRCPYGNKRLRLNTDGMVFITYPQCNKKQDEGGGG